MGIFNKYKITLKFLKNKEKVQYKNVVGFFMFNEHLFYRPTKSTAGREVGNENVTFTEFLTTALPVDDAKTSTTKRVGEALVTPLKVI